MNVERPQFYVGVAAIVLDSHERVLLEHKHKDDPMFPGKWVLPGGSLEHDDVSPQHAIFRELFEEASFLPTHWDCSLLTSEFRSSGDHQWLMLYYTIRPHSVVDVHNREPAKRRGFGWVPTGNLNSPECPTLEHEVRLIRKAVEQR